jgi:hypothetical protein
MNERLSMCFKSLLGRRSPPNDISMVAPQMEGHHSHVTAMHGPSRASFIVCFLLQHQRRNQVSMEFAPILVPLTLIQAALPLKPYSLDTSLPSRLARHNFADINLRSIWRLRARPSNIATMMEVKLLACTRRFCVTR